MLELVKSVVVISAEGAVKDVDTVRLGTVRYCETSTDVNDAAFTLSFSVTLIVLKLALPAVVLGVVMLFVMTSLAMVMLTDSTFVAIKSFALKMSKFPQEAFNCLKSAKPNTEQL